MKILYRSVIFVVLSFLFVQERVLAIENKIKVVASVPDLADMARQIGAELVEVSSIAKGVEDPHAIPMKPSFAVQLNRADILIVQGLGLEHAFLPGLLEAARNPKIMPENPGYVDCSIHLVPLDIPLRIDRSLGEQHAKGNPHYNLDPISGRSAAKAIAQGLSRNFPQHESFFKKNLDEYISELNKWIALWEVKARVLKGVKFVSYHPDFKYLATRYGMLEAGTIEIRPGVDATPSHISDLEELMIKEKVKLVIREKHYPASLAKTVALKTGAKLVELPIMTNGVPEAKDYISFIDYNLNQLLSAVAQEQN